MILRTHTKQQHHSVATSRRVRSSASFQGIGLMRARSLQPFGFLLYSYSLPSLLWYQYVMIMNSVFGLFMIMPYLDSWLSCWFTMYCPPSHHNFHYYHKTIWYENESNPILSIHFGNPTSTSPQIKRFPPPRDEEFHGAIGLARQNHVLIGLVLAGPSESSDRWLSESMGLSWSMNGISQNVNGRLSV